MSGWTTWRSPSQAEKSDCVMNIIGNGAAKRKSKENIDPLFFQRWQSMSPHERGTEEAKEEFRTHKKEWTERTIPGLRGLTATQRLHLRSIGDLVSFGDTPVANAGTARVSLQTLAEICATSPGSVRLTLSPIHRNIHRNIQGRYSPTLS